MMGIYINKGHALACAAKQLIWIMHNVAGDEMAGPTNTRGDLNIYY